MKHEDSRSGPSVYFRRAERTDGIPRDPVYFQTLDFTCGPAALITAMAELDPSYIPSQLEELNIWREANLVFMGEPPAGCGPYGLANAALRRGFAVDIFRYRIKDLFLRRTAGRKEASAQKLISTHDKQEALRAGCGLYRRKLSRAFLARQLKEDRKLLILTNHIPDGHWVLIRSLSKKDDRVIVADPYRAHGRELRNRFFSNTGRNVMNYESFESWTRHGPKKGAVMLSIGRRAAPSVLHGQPPPDP